MAEAAQTAAALATIQARRRGFRFSLIPRARRQERGLLVVRARWGNFPCSHPFPLTQERYDSELADVRSRLSRKEAAAAADCAAAARRCDEALARAQYLEGSLQALTVERVERERALKVGVSPRVFPRV